MFKSDGKVADPAVQDAIVSLTKKLGGIEGISARGPFDQGGEFQIAPTGNIAYIEVDFAEGASQADALRVTKQVKKLLPTVPGLQVEIGGEAFAEFEPPSSEVFGLAFAIFILSGVVRLGAGHGTSRRRRTRQASLPAP